MNKSESLENVLESLIDKYSLCGVVALLGSIAAEKALHIEENWQDRNGIKAWLKAGKKLDVLAHDIQDMGI